jgi:threonine dehydrogenase-like Zn-dependent dehydrogenase
MRALTFRTETSLLLLDDDCSLPKVSPGEVLIRVHLASICSTDLEIVKGYMGFSGVLGHEFVGTVVEAPADRSDLLGKRVVAEINCVAPGSPARDDEARKHAVPRTVLGILGRDGAFAEYVPVPAENCHVVPDHVADNQAVFTEPLAAAVQVTKDHEVTPDTHAAVIGSGRLGILCAQVLALQKCKLDVIGRNPRTLGVCRGLGLNATKVADRDTALYDLVVECTGSPDGLRLALEIVRPRGTVVLKSTYAAPPEVDLSPIVINEITVAGNRCGPFADALRLLAEGRIQTDPLIDVVYALSRAIEAFGVAARPGALKVLLDPRI